MANMVGVDLGGTNIKTALVSPNGKIVKKYEIPTEAKKREKRVIENIFSAIEEVKKGKIIGIGIGSPGPMNFKNGVITNPVNLPFKNTSLRKIVQRRFKAKTFLDNDANCFAMAEAIFGQGKKYENVVGITLGTGMGGGVIINKKIYHGRNNAAELGHLTINYNGPSSKCGNHGCVETHVAAEGIKRIFDKKSDPFKIHKLAMKGNRKAAEALEKMGFFLGVGVTNLMYAFDPDIIIIGGKISNAWKFFSKEMNNTIKKRYFSKPCRIIKSNLREAGVLGAAALVLENR